jgi:hypothetical protein
MSVVKSEQGESRVQFLETGRNIYKAVMARMHPAQSGLLFHTTRDRLFQITV